jgi:FAD/FMN-containing dehydrogenase
MLDQSDSVELSSRLKAHGFAGDVVTPEHPRYDEVREVWNGSYDKRPAVIALCRNSADVAATVNFARDARVPFAIRGGGHSFGGFSTLDDGLVIDLRLMKRIHVDPERRRVVAQAGVLMKELDAATSAHGLAVPVGTMGTTGIAGLTLSGGLGWLTREHGLTCDNVEEMEVVTAAGEIVRASASENAELFWALRGGGGNFGVVTSFEYQAHAVSELLMDVSLYALGDGTKMLRAWRDWVAVLPDHMMSYVVYWRLRDYPELPGLAPALANELRQQDFWMVIVKSSVEQGLPAEAVKPLREAAPTLYHTGFQVPLDVMNSAGDAVEPSGTRKYIKSVMLGEIPVELLVEIATQKPGNKSMLEMGVLGGVVARHPEDFSAFPNRHGQAVVGLASYEEDGADPRQVALDRAWVRESWEKLQPYAIGFYSNFESDDEYGHLRSYFGEQKYAKLQAIKRVWDPENLFCRNQNIPPA